METTSFRLPSELVRALQGAARKRGVSRSELVRDALAAWLGTAAAGPVTTGALVDALVTWKGSGRGELATDGERILRERFRARRRSR
jgi:Arc/MetJ-type ribon-helix-helix transcriptional regulator